MSRGGRPVHLLAVPMAVAAVVMVAVLAACSPIVLADPDEVHLGRWDAPAA